MAKSAKKTAKKKTTRARKAVKTANTRKSTRKATRAGKAVKTVKKKAATTKVARKTRKAAPKRAKAAPAARRRPRPARAAVSAAQAPARPVARVEAVPTDRKPRKNQAGISPRDLGHFRDLLLAKRRELIGDMSAMEREALRSAGTTNLSNLPLHMADMGTDNYEQEFTLGLVEKDRQLLREINNSLAKIQDGTYGLCEATGKPISKARLEAQPWARHSIEHARAMEKNQYRR